MWGAVDDEFRSNEEANVMARAHAGQRDVSLSMAKDVGLQRFSQIYRLAEKMVRFYRC